MQHMRTRPSSFWILTKCTISSDCIRKQTLKNTLINKFSLIYRFQENMFRAYLLFLIKSCVSVSLALATTGLWKAQVWRLLAEAETAVRSERSCRPERHLFLRQCPHHNDWGRKQTSLAKLLPSHHQLWLLMLGRRTNVDHLRAVNAGTSDKSSSQPVHTPVHRPAFVPVSDLLKGYFKWWNWTAWLLHWALRVGWSLEGSVWFIPGARLLSQSKGQNCSEKNPHHQIFTCWLSALLPD